MEKPVPVTLMHCSADVPQRLFCTTYRFWIVAVPYCSQICVSAWATPLITNAVAAPAISRAAAAMARIGRFMG